MKKTIISIIIMIFCAGITVGIGITYNNKKQADSENSDFANAEEEIAVYDSNNASSLIVWYCDKEMEDYIDTVVNAFSSEKNVAIKASYVAESEMLEKINASNIDEDEQSADIYFIGSESLEKAFLAGLTETVDDMEIFNEENFSQTAISACTYQGKMIAYPLCYETSVLAYNSDYVSAAPEKFDSILEDASNDEIEYPKNITSILKWDVKHLQYNFAFAGSYLEYGGSNGDDETILNLNNSRVLETMEYYYDLYQFFSIDINDAAYDDVLEEFINGDYIYTIVNSKDIAKLEESGISYGIAVIPDMTDELSTTALSLTTTAIINPYSENESVAGDFIKYIAYDNAGIIYDSCGYMPCAKVENYETGTMSTVVQAYDESISLPKLMSASDYWVYLEIALNEVWSGEDIEETMNALQEQMEK